jgi:hypothetical protein
MIVVLRAKIFIPFRFGTRVKVGQLSLAEVLSVTDSVNERYKLRLSAPIGVHRAY